VEKVKEILFEVAHDHPGALMEPEPQLFFQDYGPSSLDFLFGVWVRTESYFEVRNDLREMIKRRFDEEGIEIPFPHTSLYTGSATEPFPVRIVGDVPPVPMGGQVEGDSRASQRASPPTNHND
jgi:small-conductance mechanosensitive channel